jgi:hypothetical protein
LPVTMDLYQVIRELREEMTRLDQVILFLEQLRHAEDADGGRRGAKGISETAQQAVSQRMKKYFARRKGRGGRSDK